MLLKKAIQKTATTVIVPLYYMYFFLLFPHHFFLFTFVRPLEFFNVDIFPQESRLVAPHVQQTTQGREGSLEEDADIERRRSERV